MKEIILRTIEALEAEQEKLGKNWYADEIRDLKTELRRIENHET